MTYHAGNIADAFKRIINSSGHIDDHLLDGLFVILGINKFRDAEFLS